MSLLFDTDILIDYLRNRPEAVSYVEENLNGGFLSAMTVAELFQGVRKGDEHTQLSRMITAFSVLPITAEIAERAGLYCRDFRPSHGCGLADCLIAATADLHGLTLETLNARHYPMLERVNVPYRK